MGQALFLTQALPRLLSSAKIRATSLGPRVTQKDLGQWPLRHLLRASTWRPVSQVHASHHLPWAQMDGPASAPPTFAPSQRHPCAEGYVHARIPCAIPHTTEQTGSPVSANTCRMRKNQQHAKDPLCHQVGTGAFCSLLQAHQGLQFLRGKGRLRHLSSPSEHSTEPEVGPSLRRLTAP